MPFRRRLAALTTSVQAQPLSLDGSSMAYDSARQRMVLFGGSSFDPELYEWDADPARQPAIQFISSAMNPGIGTVTGLRVRALCGATSPTRDGAPRWWAGRTGSEA